MNDGRRPLQAALAAAALVAGFSLIVASGLVAGGSAAIALLLVNTVVFPELLDFAIRLYFRSINMAGRTGVGPMPSVALRVPEFTPYQRRLHIKPYALVVSVYNLGGELYAFLDGMAPHLGRLWVIDDGSTDGTGDRLRAAGCRCIAGSRNQRKPGALRELVAQLPAEIQTVVVFDPDTTFLNRGTGELPDLEQVIFDFQQSRMAALCPRIRVRSDGLLSTLQGFEYALSLLVGRKSLADFSINSGVAIYRRTALERASGEHSRSVYAEDLEYSLILLGAGERIYFDDRLVVETAGKQTWRGLFLQRVGWSFGYVKVYVEQFANVRRIARRQPMAAYQYLLYLGLLGLLLHPLRLAAVVVIGMSFLNGVDALLGTGLVPDRALTTPWIFLSSYLQCLVLAGLGLALVPRGERLHLLRAVPLYFFYSTALAVPMTVGFLNWFTVRFWRRRLMRDPYQDEASLIAELGYPLAGVPNA